MHRTPKGYVVIKIKVQGRTVVDEEILTEGVVPRMDAENVLKVAVMRDFIFPRDAS